MRPIDSMKIRSSKIKLFIVVTLVLRKTRSSKMRPFDLMFNQILLRILIAAH